MMSVVSPRPGTVAPRRLDLRQVLVDGVEPAHPAEQLVVARLHREVQLLADGGEIAHRPEQLGDGVARMGGEEAQPPQAGHTVHGGEQLGQPGTAAGVAVGVDVLAEEGDLADATLHQAVDVLHDLPHRPADLPAADEGDDAVRAHLVASTHHRDVGEQAVGGGHRQRPVEVVGVGGLEPGEEAVAVPHVEEVVEVGQPAEERVPVLHRHAAGHGDGPAGTCALPLGELAELPVDLLLRVLADRAGDEDREVAVVERGVGHETDLGEALGESISWSASFIWQPMCQRWTRGGRPRTGTIGCRGMGSLGHGQRPEAAGGGAEQGKGRGHGRFTAYPVPRTGGDGAARALPEWQAQWSGTSWRSQSSSSSSAASWRSGCWAGAAAERLARRRRSCSGAGGTTCTGAAIARTEPQRDSMRRRMPVRSSPSIEMSMNEGMQTRSIPPGAT